MAPGTLAHSEGPLHYWRGEGPLWRLYWIYGVLVSTAGGTLLLTATLYRLLSPWAILALVVVGLAYTVWILVSTWRCAFNIENPRVFGVEREALGWLARVLTFGWALNAMGASLLLLQIAFGVVSV
jgi:hypothetical protein